MLTLPDGNLLFEIVTGMARGLTVARECPGMIVVAVGYPLERFSMAAFGSRRPADLTAAVDERYIDFVRQATGFSGTFEMGGAEGFLRFLLEEVRPEIEARYRTRQDHALLGHSTGGHFALYTLLSRPEAFGRYVIGSPSLGMSDRVLFDLEAQRAASGDGLAARVFLGIGELEEHAAWSPSGYLGTIVSVSDFYRFAAALRSRGYPRLALSSRVFEGFNHMSVIGSVLGAGLPFVFAED